MKAGFLRILWFILIYLMFSLPFRQIATLIPGTEIRPANMLPPVLGILFGAQAAWGTAIGNLIGDMVYGQTTLMFIPGFITNFLYSYLPYKMWYGLKLGQREITPPNVNTLSGLLKFIYIIFLDSALTTGALTLIFEIAGLKPASSSVWLLFFNNFNFAILLGIPVMSLVPNLKISLCIPHENKEIVPKNRGNCVPGSQDNRTSVSDRRLWLDALLYAALTMEIIFVLFSISQGDIFHKKIAGYLYLVVTAMTLFYMGKPAAAYIEEHSRNESVRFSIKAKVTIVFLLLSAIFIVFIGATALNAMVAVRASTRVELWNYIYLVVGIAINFILAVTVIFLGYVERSITNPLEQLSDLVRKYNGRENQKASENIRLMEQCHNIKSRDEIGALSKAFGSMIGDIDRYVNNLQAVTADRERIFAELNVAARIQASMLPDTFPAFTDCSVFEIHAVMLPAKEVGGDFYDFFFLNGDRLGIVIADVSGKGVPAALFMVVAKTLIKNHAQLGEMPHEIFTSVNSQLCENNREGLFVTAWLGILDLKTLTLTYANAGHNPPIIKRGDDGFFELKCRPGLVLAGMENFVYHQDSLCLSGGDVLFLYTDGVTEAMDTEDGLYGADRLIKQLNCHGGWPLEKILCEVKADIDLFAGAARQYDDITMLIIRIKDTGGVHSDEDIGGRRKKGGTGTGNEICES